MVRLVPISWLVGFRNWNDVRAACTFKHFIGQRACSSPRQPGNTAGMHADIDSDYRKGSNSNTNEQPQETFATVEGQKFATQISDDTLINSERLHSNKQHAPPPSPKYSMLRRWCMSWCCEISSVRPASLRRPYGQPTLNFGGGRGLCKVKAQHSMLTYSCCELLSVNSPR